MAEIRETGPGLPGGQQAGRAKEFRLRTGGRTHGGCSRNCVQRSLDCSGARDPLRARVRALQLSRCAGAVRAVIAHAPRDAVTPEAGWRRCLSTPYTFQPWMMVARFGHVEENTALSASAWWRWVQRQLCWRSSSIGDRSRRSRRSNVRVPGTRTTVLAHRREPNRHPSCRATRSSPSISFAIGNEPMAPAPRRRRSTLVAGLLPSP